MQCAEPAQSQQHVCNGVSPPPRAGLPRFSRARAHPHECVRTPYHVHNNWYAAGHHHPEPWSPPRSSSCVSARASCPHLGVFGAGPNPVCESSKVAVQGQHRHAPLPRLPLQVRLDTRQGAEHGAVSVREGRTQERCHIRLPARVIHPSVCLTHSS